MSEIDKLRQVVDALGGRRAVGELLGVTHVAMHYWLTGKEQLPTTRALKLAQMSATTDTPVSVYDLRPDLRVL